MPRGGRVSDAVGMRALQVCKQLVTHCIAMAPTACAAAAPRVRREGAAGRFLYALAALRSPQLAGTVGPRRGAFPSSFVLALAPLAWR